MHNLNGANVLLLIRDGGCRDLRSLCDHYGFNLSGGSHYVTSVLEGLERANLISKDPFDSAGWENVRINPTSHVLQLQRELGLSLKQLARNDADSIVVTPFFGAASAPGRAVDLFVLMPFNDALLPVYKDHIKKVAEDLKISVKRADDFFSVRHVMADVWQGIWGARAIVADCTGRNPNVFYEIGIAHTVGRPVILITQKHEDVPFDLQAVRYIQYDYTPRGMADFEAEMKMTLMTILNLGGGGNPYAGTQDPYPYK